MFYMLAILSLMEFGMVVKHQAQYNGVVPMHQISKVLKVHRKSCLPNVKFYQQIK